MRTRALTLVALMLLMLAATPQFEAMPTGIGAAVITDVPATVGLLATPP